MATVTFLQIRQWAAQRADMENSTFIGTQESKDAANQSIRAWRDMLMKAASGDELFEKDPAQSISTVSGTPSYALASDFERITTVYYLDSSGRYLRIPKYMPTESEDAYANQGWSDMGFWGGGIGNLNIKYRLKGSKIWFIPTPLQVYTVKVNYIPTFTDLVADGDPIDCYGRERWIVWDLAAAYKDKQESDPSYCISQRDKEEARIVAMADRSDNDPPKLQDTRRDTGW